MRKLLPVLLLLSLLLSLLPGPLAAQDAPDQGDAVQTPDQKSQIFLPPWRAARRVPLCVMKRGSHSNPRGRMNLPRQAMPHGVSANTDQ
jgi:hypothetical protein